MKKKKVEKDFADNDFEFMPERFVLFQNILFGRNNVGDSTSSGWSQVFARNIKAVRFAAAIIIATMIYWILVDIVKGGAMNLLMPLPLTIMIIEIFLSIYMILLTKLPFMTQKIIRFSFLIYYIFLMATVCILIYTKNLTMVEQGTTNSLFGIHLSSVYLLILVLIPLPSGIDSLILLGCGVVLTLLPEFLPCNEVYELNLYVIFYLCMIFAYWYIRRVNIALADSMQRLSVLSFTDPLTKVLNRRSLDAYWSEICKAKKANSIGVLIFDIDDFKNYNDHYTHSKGDLVLSRVAEVAVSAIENENGFLFRYGGEEFVVLLLDYDEDKLVKCARNINEAVYNDFIQRNDLIGFDRITISVGCAIEKIDKDICRDYITNADNQLYVGKNNGKNCVVYNETIYRISK